MREKEENVMSSQRSYRSLITAALLFTAISTAFGQRTYDCGNLNQRACGTGDWERVNMVAGENHACEVDLIKSDGYCRNQIRNTLVVRNPFWTGWALENQMYGISAN